MDTARQARGTAWRRVWPWARAVVGLAILVALLVKLGAAPFLHGFASVRVTDVVAVALLTLVFTVASAWRWKVVAGRLGLTLTIREGTSAYYRSQFLNSVLPGGVLGDVHRGVRHGRDSGDLGRGVRAVAWDRFVGQIVQNGAVVLALLTLPSPLRDVRVAEIAGVGVVVLLVAGWLLLHVGSPGRSGVLRRLRAVLADEARALAGDFPTVWRIVVSSVAITGGHLVTFLIALHATGTEISLSRAVPLGMAILAAASIPGSLAGWGPREGVAAWAFAAAGLGASAGVAATSLYALLRLVATLPGAVLLLQPGGSSLRGSAATARDRVV